jgi:hypothetical protein
VSSTLTPAQFAAAFAVERCLPLIQGKTISDPPPTPPVALTEDERNKLGLTEESLTFFYATGDAGVFLDSAHAKQTLWFNGADCEQGVAIFDRRLKQAHPQARQVDDLVSPSMPGMRARVYEVDLGGDLLAWIEVAYPAAGARANARKFVIRIEPRHRTKR